MSAQHTAGPWSVVKRRDGTMVVLTRDANGSPKKHIAEMAWADSEDGEPDARLIAAAPDLLEALEAALLVHGDGYSWGPQARAAIAKAIGAA